MLFRKLCFIFVASNFVFSGYVQSEEVDRGKLLYENHCGACHTTEVHKRGNRKVNSLVDLSRMVIRWQYHLKLEWSFDEVSQVMSFLNQRFYQIDKRP